MSRLGQFDFYDSFDTSGFTDVGDWSTDIFDWGAVDLDYGWDTALFDTSFGLDENYLYDLNTTDTLGYDVFDPLYGDPYMDTVYDPALTTLDDYGDLWATPSYEDVVTEDWTAFEEAAAFDVEQTYGGNVDVAADTFSGAFPDVDWKALVAQGKDIYKLYASLQQPAGATGPKPTLMRDPRTGQLVPAVIDPRTGQLVPAARDPRTGMLVPASSIQQAGIIPGVPNTVLFAGIGIAAFMLFR